MVLAFGPRAFCRDDKIYPIWISNQQGIDPGDECQWWSNKRSTWLSVQISNKHNKGVDHTDNNDNNAVKHLTMAGVTSRRETGSTVALWDAWQTYLDDGNVSGTGISGADISQLSCTFRSEFRKNSDSVGISGKIRRNMFPIGKEIVCTYVRQQSSFSDCVQTVPWVT